MEKKSRARTAHHAPRKVRGGASASRSQRAKRPKKESKREADGDDDDADKEDAGGEEKAEEKEGGKGKGKDKKGGGTKKRAKKPGGKKKKGDDKWRTDFRFSAAHYCAVLVNMGLARPRLDGDLPDTTELDRIKGVAPIASLAAMTPAKRQGAIVRGLALGFGRAIPKLAHVYHQTSDMGTVFRAHEPPHNTVYVVPCHHKDASMAVVDRQTEWMQIFSKAGAALPLLYPPLVTDAETLVDFVDAPKFTGWEAYGVVRMAPIQCTLSMWLNLEHAEPELAAMALALRSLVDRLRAARLSYEFVSLSNVGVRTTVEEPLAYDVAFLSIDLLYARCDDDRVGLAIFVDVLKRRVKPGPPASKSAGDDGDGDDDDGDAPDKSPRLNRSANAAALLARLS